MTDSNTCVPFRDLLTGPRFGYGAEVVTTRGVVVPGSPNDIVAFAKALLADPRIGWTSITDSPGGAPMLPPDWLGRILTEHAPRVVLHMTCKDINRNGLEAAAWRYTAEGFHNILALTGDLPTTGFGGTAGGVFDIDSTALIAMLRSMNEGLQVPNRKGGFETLPKANFFIGCAVSPFKRRESELMPQYFKLVRKIAAGAQWIVPQLGYDMRKFHEVKLMLASRGITGILIVGNVYLLSKGVAKIFNSGKLAGCVVSDELLATVEKYAAGPDKGRKFCQELAAKQLAVFKGLGFAAGYLGGMAKAESFSQIIDMAESYGPDDWRDFIKEIQFSQPDEFFLFDHDPQTGLSEPTHINPAYRESLRKPPKTKHVTLGYRFSRCVHRWFFTRDKGFWGLMRRLSGKWDKKPGVLGRLAFATEKTSKRLIYGCQDCGDCSLPDCAYLCPRHSCSKTGRNGPCGGSAGGRCELDDKECFWARVYERLKYYGESERMFDRPLTLYNANLQNTSSWINTYLDRDHNAPPAAAEAPPAAEKKP
jgi:methylenetetrahydrofolate reductase (NADPH)